MKQSAKDDFLTFFSISLTVIAVSTMIYMARTPSLTGTVVLDDSATTIGVIAILILAGIAVVIGAVIAIHKLKQELEEHKKAMPENKTQLVDNPNVELAEYVFKAKQAGFTDDQILNKLKDSWNPKEVKKYLKK